MKGYNHIFVHACSFLGSRLPLLLCLFGPGPPRNGRSGGPVSNGNWVTDRQCCAEIPRNRTLPNIARAFRCAAAMSGAETVTCVPLGRRKRNWIEAVIVVFRLIVCFLRSGVAVRVPPKPPEGQDSG